MNNWILALIGLGLIVLWRRSTISRRSLQNKLSVVELAIPAQGQEILRQAKALEATQKLLTLQREELEAVQNRAKILEKKLKSKLTDEQIEFKELMEKQYLLLFEELKEEIKKEVAGSKEKVVEGIEKAEKVFAEKLAKAFEDACEKIKFDEIVYKRTITKKRKEFTRKNGKDAKPQQIWRYIDED